MNLTSHEFVVCQEEKKSPLILSEFAGSSGSLASAIHVNPWDYEEVAEAIREALEMSDEEKAVKHQVNPSLYSPYLPFPNHRRHFHYDSRLSSSSRLTQFSSGPRAF